MEAPHRRAHRHAPVPCWAVASLLLLGAASAGEGQGRAGGDLVVCSKFWAAAGWC